VSAPLSSTPGTRLTVFAIVVLAAALRLWTVDSGIPHTVAVDEPAIMGRALNILKTGDFNPHFFDYGGLTIYMHAAVASARFATGALSRKWTSLDQVWAGDFYLWARIVTALIGTLTVYVTYRAARRWGLAVALIASLMMAVQPNHVLESHRALTDVPLTFFVALTFLLSLVSAEDGRLRWFLLAGAAAGLATATKYNGVLAMIMPVMVAYTMQGVRLRSAAILTTGAGTVVAFLIAAPYSLLDVREFLNGFASLASHYAAERAPSQVADTYLGYLRNSFGVGEAGWWVFIGWPAVLFSLAGMLVLAYQIRWRPQRAAALAVLVYSLAYVWVLVHQSLAYARYALPIVPMICLAAGVGITTVCRAIWRGSASGLTRRRMLAVMLVLIVPPAFQAVRSDWSRRKVGTDELMARWIQTNIDPKAHIVSEATTIQMPPQFSSFETTNKLIHETIDAYRQREVTYLVASSSQSDVFFSDEPNHAGEVARYRRIFETADIVKIQSPTSDHPGATVTVLKLR
jgi:4-amino-4-deoxy-L-arabinose transferase-like glycosyltransferase